MVRHKEGICHELIPRLRVPIRMRTTTSTSHEFGICQLDKRYYLARQKKKKKIDVNIQFHMLRD